MARIIAPKSLSTALKRSFGRLAAELAERGIDVQARRDLLADYVQLGDRLDVLREQELAASGSERLAVSRALSVATAERRRLHEKLWQGARPAGLVLTPAEAAATDQQAEADRAWREWFASLKGLRQGADDAAIAAAHLRENEIKARYGNPSWAVLLDESSARFLQGQTAHEAERRAAGLPVDDDTQAYDDV